MRAASLVRSFVLRKHPFPRTLVGASIGLSLGSAMIVKQQPTAHLNPPTVPRLGESAIYREDTSLDPDLMKQLSGGSISGSSSSLPRNLFELLISAPRFSQRVIHRHLFTDAGAAVRGGRGGGSGTHARLRSLLSLPVSI